MKMFLLEQMYGVVLNGNSNHLSEFIVFLFSHFYLFCQSILKHLYHTCKSESSNALMEPNYFDR